MTKVKDIYKYLDKLAPFNSAMDFDNCGLLVGDMEQDVRNVMISLDITKEVVKEASNNDIQLIISHHPIIFKPLKYINSNSVPYMLANSEISAICAHTNLDMADEGVNTCLADALELNNIHPLSIYKKEYYNKIVVFAPKEYESIIIEKMSENGAGELGDYSKCSFSSFGLGKYLCGKDSNPFIGKPNKYEITDEIKIEMICKKCDTKNVISAMKSVHPYEEPAFDVFEDKAIRYNIPLGLVGRLDKAMNSKEFAYYVKDKLKCEGVRYTEQNEKINKVAVCSGAGGDLVKDAFKCGAEAFVTGEIKHNQILEANDFNITVVDAGHFKTEDVVIERLVKMLSKKFSNVKFSKSLCFNDKIKYIS